MAGIQVVTDSACDLAPEMADDRGVPVVPLSIRFGTEEFVDRTELTTKEFWDRVITSPVMPETAAPSPGAFQRVFEEAAAEGHTGIVCVTLSSRLSATYQAASTAADAVGDAIAVRVVDSLSVTMGQGLLVLAAVDLIDQGASLDELVTEIEDLKSRTRTYGAIESLDFLRRGGRIGNASHLVGSLLSIKPVIEIRDGVVEVESRPRTRQRSVQYLASKALEAGPLERLAVSNGAAQDIGDLLEALRAATPAHDMVVTDLGPVIGSHAGPGTMGVCFQLAR